MEKALKNIQEELMQKGEVRLGGLGKMYLHNFSSSTNKFTKDARLRGSTIYFEHNADELGESINNEFAKTVLEGLDLGNSFSIPNLGNFFKNSSNKITFLASPMVNLSKETFGFKQVRVDGEAKDWLTWLANTNNAESKLDTPLVINESSSESKQTVKINIDKPVEHEKMEAPSVEIKKQDLPKVAPMVERPKEVKKIQKTEKAQPEPIVAADFEWIEKVEKRPLFIVPRLIASFLLIAAAISSIYFGQRMLVSDASASTENNTVKPNDIKKTGSDKVTSSFEDSLVKLTPSEKSQFMASVIRSSASYIEKLKTQPGDYYVVAGTYSSENFALTQCMRWKNMGIEVASASLVSSKNYKIVIARYVDKDDAEMFSKQIPMLDGAPILVQKLEVKYP